MHIGFRKSNSYGPVHQQNFNGWQEYVAAAKAAQKSKTTKRCKHLIYSIFGCYRKDLPALGAGGHGHDAINFSIHQTKQNLQQSNTNIEGSSASHVERSHEPSLIKNPKPPPPSNA